jgi:predicted aspartyl protease
MHTHTHIYNAQEEVEILMYLLDTGAQPVILGVQFIKKMGMFDTKLRKSMWQIRTASGSIDEVLGESLDLIALN